MKKYALILLCLLCSHYYSFSESIYTWDLKKDIIIGSFSLSVFLPPLFIDASPGNTIQKDDINAVDKSLMFKYNKNLDTISTWAAYGTLVIPGLSLLGNIKDYNAWLSYGTMYAEAFLLTYGTKDILKTAIARNRPYTYFGGIPKGEEEDYYNSFPSGHTSFAFLGATFLSTTFYHEYPDSKWKVPVIIGSYAAATGIASMRILSGNHFITDVIAGAVIGSLYGWLIPTLHLRAREGLNTNVEIIPIGNGIIATMSF
ncbi:phosphatase PAP2 family protein [Treponema primitia]|nr:phosphatase PAP2 family protein [Treponema primitia]